MIKTFGMAAVLVLGIASAQAFEIREFHIAKGTGEGRWNTEAEIVTVRKGDVLRIYNDDVVDHQLHTFGAPCEHGSNIAPGEFGDHSIISTFESKAGETLYDHHYGPKAEFWIRATE